MEVRSREVMGYAWEKGWRPSLRKSHWGQGRKNKKEKRLSYMEDSSHSGRKEWDEMEGELDPVLCTIRDVEYMFEQDFQTGPCVKSLVAKGRGCEGGVSFNLPPSPTQWRPQRPQRKC